MTKILFKISFILIIPIMFGCNSGGQQGAETTASNDAAATTVEIVKATKSKAVCIWDNVGVRETPGAQGKWMTSLSIGETMMNLGMDSVVEEKTYTKVLLNDEKEGWARKDFIISDAKPAVILKDADLYSRPDLLTKSDKKFSKMDIISSIEEQDDWIRIKGKRSDGKWIDEGWIKGANLSYAAVDVATAKFAKEAFELEAGEEQMAAIKEIIDNSDLSESKFIAELVVYLTDLSESDSEESMSETDSVQ